MKILIVAATAEEVGSLKSEVLSQSQESRVRNQEPQDITQDFRLQTFDFELLITGVGMVATAFALGRHLVSNQYDLVVNLGIAGSFDRNIALGDVLEITEDTFAELGAEDDDAFLSIEEMGFGQRTYFPSTKLSNLYNLFNTFNLKTASAITVNTVHGNEASIKEISERLHPQLESMEGAAFFYACNQMNVPCIQIRAVSNYVEKRNRDHWETGLAIKNLNTFALEFLKLYA
ncbi:MAG: futalosine hydrolase [Sphingobacteriales bacterium]